MKTWFSNDGYERIRLNSLKHKKRVNRTVHLLVGEAFLNGGVYVGDTRQINHKDGIKANNHIDNLELVTGTENVNHAHENDLYTFNLKIQLLDKISNEKLTFRSLREASRYLKVSMNFIRPRIVISKYFPIHNRYVLSIDLKKYIEYISTIKNNKIIYVYSHINSKFYTLTSFVQISFLFGISYINIGRVLNKKPCTKYYIGGFTFSLSKLTDTNVEKISKNRAMMDRYNIWKKLAMNVNNVRLKRVGIESLKWKR